ncbi:virulence-associated protein E [bacterium C-53]|nr:virulence-associated protein E [Lachnospiraceae bacterium]NBI02950.1 virulence-associated protein E [Lachnospiraceae bacterium]RKJ10573.1 virulence-associated protein E [bacterium C-53]
MMQNDRIIKITTGSSRKSLTWNGQEMYWSDFLQKLSQPLRTQESFEQYKALPKSEQDKLKDIGGYVGGVLKGPRRKNENAGDRYLITLDADTIEPGGTQKVLNTLAALGCAYAVYSTRKHEGAAPRLRVIIPLNEPCTADEYEPIARKAASFIGMQIFDPTTFEPVRLMYWPSCSKDSQYIFLYEDKPFVSKNGMLKSYRDWRDVSEWPEVPGATKIRDRSAKKQGDPLEKKGIVGAFCRNYSIEDAMEQLIPGVYEPCADSGRFTFVEGSTVGGAVLYENGRFLYSHHATDPCSGRLVNAFDMVRLHLFGGEDDEAKPDTPAANLPSFRKMCEFASELPVVSEMMAKERYETAIQNFSGALASDPDADAEWVLKLQANPKTGSPLNTIQNVQTILENDPSLKGRIYHDEMAGRPMVAAPLPWEPQKFPYAARQWKDEDDSGLRGYMESVYQITGKEKIMDGFAVFALNHRVNKLKDYLVSLVWDGVPRVDTLLIDYFGAENSIYVREAIRKTLVGAVARILCPGIKFDTMLILAGKQGIGKSTFFKYLGMEWYSDSLCTFEGKDAAELLQGYWIIEAGELTGMSKSEMNTVKQFLSKGDDVYRAAYGRRTEKHLRQCIIVGTTNEAEFLKDYTGNRRFWPVDLTGTGCLKNIRRDMPSELPQIWAEAVMLYRLGEPLILSSEAEKIAENVQEEHREASYSEGAIVEFLEKKVPKDWYKKSLYERQSWLNSEFDQKKADESQMMHRDRICAWEIWNECFRMPGYNRMRKSDSKEINSILERLPGWAKQKNAIRFGGEYGMQRGFQRLTSKM